MKKILLGFVLGVLLASAPIHADTFVDKLNKLLDRSSRMMDAEAALINEYNETVEEMNALSNAQVDNVYAKHYPALVKKRDEISKISHEKE